MSTSAKKLSPERIAEIRNGLLNVSDGPWAWETHGDDGSFSIGIVDPPQTGQIVERFDEETETFASLPIVVEHIAENGGDATFADASFIADARQAVPELLGHIEALEADTLQMIASFTEAHDREVGRERRRADNLATSFGMAMKELAESRAECERLQTELRTYRAITATPLDPSEKNRLEAQIRDRDTLLKNENENYRRCAEECERLRVQLECRACRPNIGKRVDVRENCQACGRKIAR